MPVPNLVPYRQRVKDERRSLPDADKRIVRAREIEERHGFPGALRAPGVKGALSRPPFQ